MLQIARYGPTDPLPIQQRDDDDEDEDDEEEEDDEEDRMKKQAFRTFLKQAVETSSVDVDHLPKLMANHIDLIMSLHGLDGTQVIKELLEEAKNEGDDKKYQQLEQVIETVLTFAEELAEQAVDFDSHNKHTLGRIIKAMKANKAVLSARDREEALDELMHKEKENFTPGFLRHIEGECNRISNAPRMTPEGARLMEILRIIQTRVLEELGKDIGEAALVLGQLLGYEEEAEMMGVLDAGLTVRGRDFALEMNDLTKEALDGFRRVPGGTDPELVDRVAMIDRRLVEYLEETNEFL